MSRVAITELRYGSTAQASDINDTNTSWNSATAAGSITGENFREEGIDRRVIAQNTIYTTGRGTNNFLQTTSGITGVAAATALTFGPSTYVGPVVLGTGEYAIVGYSVWGTDDIGSVMTTLLQVSATGVGAWVDISATTRRKDVVAVAHPNGTFAAKTAWGTPGTWYFRILVNGTNADYTHATLYVYTVAV